MHGSVASDLFKEPEFGLIFPNSPLLLASEHLVEWQVQALGMPEGGRYGDQAQADSDGEAPFDKRDGGTCQ